MKTCSMLFALVLFSVLFSVFFSATAQAQDPVGALGSHSIKVFAEFSGAETGQSSGVLWGASAGGYLQGRLLGFVLRGSEESSGTNIHVYDAVAGPRLALPLPILKPFVEIGGGMGHSGYYDEQGYFGSGWGPAWQVDSGVEHGLLPRLQWRIVEAAYGRIYVGPGVSSTTISTGLTLHLW